MNLRFSFVTHSRLQFAVALAVLGLALTEALRHSYYTRKDPRSLIGPLGFPFGFLDNGHYNLTVFDFQLSATKERHRHKKKPHSRSLAAKDENNDNCSGPTGCLPEILDRLKGVGFLLKEFKDESDFHKYMKERVQTGECIFQKYLDQQDEDDAFFADGDDVYPYEYTYDDDLDGYDDYIIYDDDIYGGNYGGEYDDLYEDDGFRRQRRRKLDSELQQGFGEVIDAVEDGIFLDMLPRSRWKPNTASVSYNFQPGEGGFYFLIYQICLKKDDSRFLKEGDIFDIHSRFELDFHFSNKDMFNKVSYLSSGEMILPWLYFAFTLLYAVCLGIWHFNIKAIKEGRTGFFDVGNTQANAPSAIAGTSDSPTVYPIHYLMTVLLVLKLCSLLFDSVRFHYLRVLGHANFFSFVYYIFLFVKGSTLFTVILLIGSGWSFVKPFLTDREKKMILGVLILQVVNNLAITVLAGETEGEISFDRWTAVLHLVDIFCCCAVLMPIVWQVNQLEKNIEQNQHKGKSDEQEGQFDDHISETELEDVPMDEDENGEEAIPDARMAAKLKLFRSFYIIVMVYIYMTRIVVYLFVETLNYKHTWIKDFFDEFSALLFYCAVGYMFRPMYENPYTHIGNRKPDTAAESQVEMRVIDPSTKTALD